MFFLRKCFGLSAISKFRRFISVDSMFKALESFEMNHESIYTAIKLVHLFLTNMHIKRDALQLVGAKAVLLSSTFEI